MSKKLTPRQIAIREAYLILQDAMDNADFPHIEQGDYDKMKPYLDKIIQRLFNQLPDWYFRRSK